MHTSDGLLNDIRVFFVALEVTVDTQPVHLAAVQYLLAADDWHVVFTLASHNAGVTANALAQVDRHAPLWQSFFATAFRRVFDIRNRFGKRRLHRSTRMLTRQIFPNVRNVWLLGSTHRKIGDRIVQFNSSFADQVETSRFCFFTTAFVDGPVILSRRDFVFGEVWTCLDVVGDQHRIATANGRNIHTNCIDFFVQVAADHADLRAAVTDRQRHHARSTTGHFVNRHQHLCVARLQLDRLAVANTQCRSRVRA